MTSAATDTLAAFKRLLEEAADPEMGAPTLLTDALVGRDKAPELRRCAVPHQIDRSLMRVIAPWLTAEEAARRYEEFTELSIVQVSPCGLAIHERWRRALFAWWLRAENRAEFEQISRSLADHFAALAQASTGPEAEAARRRHMYHLLGADRAAGLSTFRSLCWQARHRWRFAEYGALIRLVRDYDGILTPPEQATVAYEEGKLAADTQDWVTAERKFRELVEDDDTSPGLRVKASARLGHVLREQGRVGEAIAELSRARDVAGEEADLPVWRLLHELGEAYRDAGALDLAERAIRRALALTRREGAAFDRSGLFNSLGTIHLQRRDLAEAVLALQTSLDELARVGDVFRPAQVQNNLGLAYSEQRDWSRAEAAFATSLDLKRQAGDVAGQALALQNLSRAQAAQDKIDEAIANATEAARMFEAVKDRRLEGIAKCRLGHYHRRRGDRVRARALFMEALDLFAATEDEAEAARVRLDLEALDGTVGLPWWAWTLIALLLAVVVLVVVGLFVS